MDINYVAGFFDGEGCFTISIHLKKGARKFIFQVSPRVSIAVSEESNDVLERIQECLGFGKIYHHTRSRRSRDGRIKKEMIFRIYRRDELEQFVRLMENKVIVKRRELNLFKRILELTESATENISEIVQIASEINPTNTSPRKWTTQRLEKILHDFRTR